MFYNNKYLDIERVIYITNITNNDMWQEFQACKGHNFCQTKNIELGYGLSWFQSTTRHQIKFDISHSPTRNSSPSSSALPPPHRRAKPAVPTAGGHFHSHVANGVYTWIVELSFAHGPPTPREWIWCVANVWIKRNRVAPRCAIPLERFYGEL